MRLLPLAFLLVASGVSAQALCEADPAQHRASTRAPLLYEIASGDGDAQDALHAYLCAYTPEALSSTADLLRALTLRDTVIARLEPRMEDWFFDGDQGYEKGGALYEEAEALALLPVSAEGMIFGLTYGPLMDGVATTLAPRDLVHYIDFLDAEGRSRGGEYPFMSLEAQAQMIAAGERLRSEFPASPYVAATQEAFGDALLTLASLHPADLGDEEPTWLVGIATADYYPWWSSRESLADFVASSPDSRYAGPLASILADPPEATAEGALEVVVGGPAFDSREDAATRALAALDAGVDALGPLLVGDEWRVVYRYYPAGDPRVAVAVDRADDLGLAPEVLTYSPEVY